MTEYDYTKTPCDVARLQQEIQTSNITTALDHIDLFGTALAIFFSSDLSANDKITLDFIVANHSGNALSVDFNEVLVVGNTSTNSGNYVVLNGMTSPPLLAGTYLITFSGTFSSDAPLLSQPGILISLFNDGVQVPGSEITQDSSTSGFMPSNPFGMSFNISVVVGANKKLDVRWKTNGAGNTISCANRVMDILKVK